MGDEVNLGARLEGLTKEYGVKIMISEKTVRAFRENHHLLRDLDDIRVKGKNEPVKVFELMRPDFLPQPEAIRNLISEFESGREAYRQQDWKKAKSHFSQCLLIRHKDGPSLKYLERIEMIASQPAVDNWDGVYTFKHK
jgi:adenylate cyclase